MWDIFLFSYINYADYHFINGGMLVEGNTGGKGIHRNRLSSGIFS
jgi:hypothetical protein